MQILGGKSIAGLVAATIAVTCLGFAAGASHKSPHRGTEVTFSSLTKFQNGDTLPAGNYWMEVSENSQTPEVTFYKEYNNQYLMTQVDSKPIATVKAKAVTRNEKNQNTEVDSVMDGNAQMVTAIRPAGSHETLIFGPAGQDGSASAGQ